MSDPKFKILVHYICDYCKENPAKLGATKLNKILWLSDLDAYISTGSPITEEKYIKRQYGPVASTLQTALSELEKEGCILIKESTTVYSPTTLYYSLKKPEISSLTAEQISLVDSIIDWAVNEHSATSISQFSHDYDAWQIAKIGETIPHYALFASNPGEINEHDINWADKSLQVN